MRLKYPKHISMKDFSHRVTLASAKDIVVSASEITIKKEAVYEAWAFIEDYKPSFQAGADGMTLSLEGTNDTRNSPTHCIYMNYRPDIDIRASAWIYEARRKSAPKWYKILGVNDYQQDSRYWEFKVRLTQQSEVASPPESPQKAPAFGVVPMQQDWPESV